MTTKKEMVKLQDKYAASRKTNLAGIWKKESIMTNKLNPRSGKLNGLVCLGFLFGFCFVSQLQRDQHLPSLLLFTHIKEATKSLIYGSDRDLVLKPNYKHSASWIAML